MQSDGEERTERPSEFKLKEARKKGQVAKSIDVVALVSFFLSALFLANFFAVGLEKWILFFNDINKLSFRRVDKVWVITANSEAFHLWFVLSMPVLCVASMGAVIGNLCQFGFLLSSHPIKIDFKRLNFIKGLKRLLKNDRLIEFLKQAVKFSTVILVISWSTKAALNNLVLLVRLELAHSLMVCLDLIAMIILRVFLCFLVIAGLDFLWQRHSFLKSMRMTKYEVKREHKQQDGDPDIKQERRRLQHETLETAAKSSVEDASVIITNPSHLAAAIKFNEDEDAVPTIIAKGMGKKAQAIINEASRHKVPIIRNVPLARDLQWLEINEEIPKHLYDSVAEVLSFVHELSQEAKGAA